jgi:threonine/homoserine/homoserine lactone efflux protein
MSNEVVLSLALFCMSIMFQPGPNNALLMAQGLNFGFRRTLPSVVGVAVGFFSILVCCIFGLAALFTALPAMHTVLKALSILYLLYVAWRIATATPRFSNEGGAPLSVTEGFVTLIISPQAWVFATSFVTAYLVPSRLMESAVLLLGVCVPMRFLGGSTWALFGQGLRPILKSERRVRTFNIAMASILVISLWPIAADLWRQLRG